MPHRRLWTSGAQDQRKDRWPLGRTIMLAVLALSGLLMFVVASEIEKLNYDNYLQKLRLDSTIDLVEVREEIEEQVFSSLLTLQELATFIGGRPDLSQADFAEFSENLLNGHDEIINIAAAPDLVVRYVYPYEPNSNVIGLDYRTNAQQLAGVERAIANRSGTMSGPIDLVQGGSGLIVRQPVYVQNGGDDDTAQLWGIVSVVIDLPAFLEAIEIPEAEETFDILILSAQNDGTETTIYGDETIADRDPVELDFDFQNGSWRLDATVDGGWPPMLRPMFATAPSCSLSRRLSSPCWPMSCTFPKHVGLPSCSSAVPSRHWTVALPCSLRPAGWWNPTRDFGKSTALSAI